MARQRETAVRFLCGSAVVLGRVIHGRYSPSYGQHPDEAVLETAIVEREPGVEVSIPFDDWLAEQPADRRTVIEAEAQAEAVYEATKERGAV